MDFLIVPTPTFASSFEDTPMDSISHAAAALWDADRIGVACTPIRTIIGDQDVEAA
jgi:hypothetical protein